MIRDIIIGDITDGKNPNDIIIGMNTDLEDVTGIGLRFVKNIIPGAGMDLGSVISFNFDETRMLHMIICHELGSGGWKRADEYVRFGMDHLNHHNTNGRHHSIVRIGTGRIGHRDGADASAIMAGITQSYLLVDLYIFDGVPMESVPKQQLPLKAFAAWHPRYGELQLAA